MLTFYPGPSKLYPQVGTYLQDAFQSGILQMNHRSSTFMDLMQETKNLLHQKLEIPADYHIYFTSSATECWEIIAQSLISDSSFHVFNGAFGEKWFEYTRKIKPNATALPFDLEETLPDFQTVADVLYLTHNETSNGTQLNKIPDFEGLIAVDATSSMAGVVLDWQKADVWFASVQKCFGLPAGLSLLVCSEKALQQAEQINDRRFYNSLLFIHENHQKNQTHYTPNVLNIYLLNRILRDLEPIQNISERIKKRAKNFYDFIEKSSFELLVNNEAVRSDTVIAVKAANLQNLQQQSQNAGITLGNGYGVWKKNTFRIANFPAISDEDFEELKLFLAKIK